jgi:PPOX class probable F420-dependent enzyme
MPTLAPEEARLRFLSARVARFGTVSAAGHPHIVPITFAHVAQDTLVSAIDHKPKRTTTLARLDNIAANPAVALLVDLYDDDWSQLWWARADGRATVLASGAGAAELAPLIARYPQYAGRPPQGPVILISVTRWSGWSYR